ncbi:MAG: multidrug effflux MFS transporter [Ilumatobacteraceae bacterium]
MSADARAAAPAAARVMRHREFVALMAACQAMVAISIDVMLPAFPDMREEFGLASDSTETAWVITAFFLGLAAGQLFYGPLSDRFGRKPPLYTGLGIMIVAALASVFAPTLGLLIVCRVVWGVGAAAPRSIAMAMIRDTFSGNLMARTMSHVMSVFVLVPAFAPGMGSIVLVVLPWRAVFGIPLVAAAVVVLWLRRMPETLPVDRRRSTSPRALAEAAGAVVRTPQTIGFAIALTCVFGLMTAYIGSSEIIIDEVFGREDQFSLIFGVLALFLACGAFLNARLVMRLGLTRMLRYSACYLVGAAAFLAIVAAATGGTPPLLLFGLAMAVLLPVVTATTPNANTAAMMPLPHVAGMAAALLGTVATGGGALLGSVIDARYDGTITPFANGVLVYSCIAALSILVLGLRTARRSLVATPDAEGHLDLVPGGD